MPLLLSLTSPATAAPRYVPAFYPTLSVAVGVAEPGDVIVVDPNDNRYDPYAEIAVAVSVDLRIESLAADVAPIPGLKIYDGARVELYNVEVVGAYATSFDLGDGDQPVAPRIFIDSGELSATSTELSYTSASGATNAIIGVDASLELYDVTINDYPSYRAVHVASDFIAGGVYAEGLVMEGNAAGALYLNGYGQGRNAALWAILDDCAFTDNHAAAGGALYGERLEALDVVDCDFDGNGADGGGGALHIDEAWFIGLSSVSFSGRQRDGSQASAADGGGVYVAGSALHLTEIYVDDATFTELLAAGRGGALYVEDADLTVEGVEAQALTADGGAFLSMSAGVLSIDELRVDGFSVGAQGGAIWLHDVADVDTDDAFADLNALTLCGGEASAGSAALGVYAEDSEVSLYQLLLVGADGADTSGVSALGGTLLVSYSSFAANSLSAVMEVDGGGELYSFANLLSSEGGGAGLRRLSSSSKVFGEHNLLWGFGDNLDNVDGADFPAADNLLDVDPLLMFPGALSGCPEGAYFFERSPAKDGVVDSDGQPADGLEEDGTPTDIGAAGGVGYPYLDRDYDEVQDRYDCAPEDRGVPSSGPEVWYDGVDQDCDGASDYDADTDGYDAAPWGEDCDDGDEDVHPGQSETWYDGVDLNCDGVDDYDADGDGVRLDDGDCDDGDAQVGPGFEEIWYDGVDQDCDGGDDYDFDGDGFSAPIGGAGGEADCDDTDPEVYPGSPHLVYDDQVDDDCDGDLELTPPDTLVGGCSSAPGRGPGAALATLAALCLLTRRRRLTSAL